MPSMEWYEWAVLVALWVIGLMMAFASTMVAKDQAKKEDAKRKEHEAEHARWHRGNRNG